VQQYRFLADYPRSQSEQRLAPQPDPIARPDEPIVQSDTESFVFNQGAGDSPRHGL
jgi:hypothetical protein